VNSCRRHQFPLPSSTILSAHLHGATGDRHYFHARLRRALLLCCSKVRT
jgi:hypothetical protein